MHSHNTHPTVVAVKLLKGTLYDCFARLIQLLDCPPRLALFRVRRSLRSAVGWARMHKPGERAHSHTPGTSRRRRTLSRQLRLRTGPCGRIGLLRRCIPHGRTRVSRVQYQRGGAPPARLLGTRGQQSTAQQQPLGLAGLAAAYADAPANADWWKLVDSDRRLDLE
jgi:hypothetical protein